MTADTNNFPFLTKNASRMMDWSGYIKLNISCRSNLYVFTKYTAFFNRETETRDFMCPDPFKLKQDFLQTGRNILPIQIMNDSSDDTNIKVIQLSKSYLCFTSFSFINNLSGKNDFNSNFKTILILILKIPHGIFANTCCSSCFCYYISCPKLWLISTFTLFLKILCDIQYYLLLLHTDRFSALSLGTPWKW